MKENIVKNAVTEFVEKYNMNSDQIKEVCESFLWASIRKLRDEDFFLYESIYQLSTIAQKNVLVTRLENEFFDIEEMFNETSTIIENAVNKSIELNGFMHDIDDSQLLEYCQNVVNDCLDIISESDDNLADKIKEFGKEKILDTLQVIVKKLPTIATIGTGIGAPLMGASFPVSILALLIVLLLSSIYSKTASSLFGVNITKEQIQILKSCTDVLGEVAKVVKSASESVKYRYTLTFQNEERCYKRAGLDPSKITSRFFAAVKEDSIFRQMLFFSEEDKLNILRNCYLENFLDRISIFFDLYFDCLKKTGNWNDVRSLSDDKFISMFRMKGGLYPICDEYRNNAVEAIRAYENLIEFIFENDKQKKSQWLLLLNRYILDKKESKENFMSNNRNNYEKNKRPQFTSDKYKKLGRNI